MDDGTQSSPIRADEHVQAVSELHSQPYHRKATPVQRFLDSAVAKLSHPALVMVLTLAIIGWISLNLAILWTGGHPPDPPPFQWLEAAASVAAVYITALILTTQRREDGLARHRDQLTLELAILGERKSAKIIELLEELRRDSPHVQDRVDSDATAMAKPADPSAVLTAIEEVNRVIAEEKN
ncbi:DUF1003 domain-containing protein [Telmatospirillum siberiense]|uniref:DUF1003 domain-containing protein n=1 Tax=Telmatospirillum siberiense TaxID=382514 RepID=A0A2N3PM35_9PROT|nr:DUF1003 domain-containing protein [Telmatospirillum siberiense]PKU21463.1 hypothetical protein CWS72_26570 [Telmatospirillum siberiense]